MVVRGLADLRQPDLAVEHLGGDHLGALPHVGLADHVGDAVAGKGELAGEMAVGVLIDHAAHRVRIFSGEHPVEHHLRHRHLAVYGLAARLEIDRLGEAFARLGEALLVEAEPLRRRHRPLVDAGDLALVHDTLPARAVLDHDARVARERRQSGALDRRVDDAYADIRNGLRRQRRELDLGRHRRQVGWVRGGDVAAHGDLRLVQFRRLAGRPRLDRAEILAHRIDAEVEARGAQRRIDVRRRECEALDPAHRSLGLLAAALVVRRRHRRRRCLRHFLGRLLLLGRRARRIRDRRFRRALFGMRRSGVGCGQAIAFAGRTEIADVHEAAVIALVAAVDHRAGGALGQDRHLAQHALANRAGDVGVVGVEPGQGIAVGRRHRRAQRARHGVHGFVDGAERRSERRLLQTLDHRLLAGEQRYEVLMGDLARQQQQHQEAEAEGGAKPALRPVTRRNHPTLTPTLQYATHAMHTRVGTRRRNGTNATAPLIAGLTLRTR